MTSIGPTCPDCGAELPPASPDSLCPACLLRTGVAEEVARPPTEQPGDGIGRYKLLEKIGEGAFGDVWMAEQEKPMRRKVALKIVKLGMDTREVVARFEAERQALALMDHPNIARVFDGGATETGRPYFVMELVRGLPVTEFCDAHQMVPRERLELFRKVCLAVQHAHQKGIIHRDLKPSNILVTVQDDQPVPKVIDFGVAKALQAHLTERTLFTRFNQWIGTPNYMSPEQAGLGSLDIDTRSDIYSLGTVLYELVTGSPPFNGTPLREKGYDAILRTIREEDPPKPSTRVTTLPRRQLLAVARQRGQTPDKLGHQLKGELDWLLLKALERERARRYESANAMATDIERYLNGQPVSAAPPSLTYLSRKFIRRHAKGLALAAMAVLPMLMAGGSLAWSARDRALRQAAAEAKIEVLLEQIRSSSNQGDVEEAAVALERAQALLAGTPVGIRAAGAVDQAASDLGMVKRLAEINESAMGSINLFDIPVLRGWATRLDNDYAQAFREYGIPMDEPEVKTLTGRIRESAIESPLLMSLDQWGILRWSHGIDGAAPLLGVAGGLDQDPWNNRIRTSILAGDLDDLTTLARDPRAPDSLPRFVVVHAAVLDHAGARNEAIDCLSKALRTYRNSFGLNFRISDLLVASGRHSEAAQYARVAMNLRPWDWGAHTFLADAMSASSGRQGKQASTYHYREALRLAPDGGIPKSNLIVHLLHLEEALRIQANPDEINTLSEELVELDNAYPGPFERMATARIRHSRDDWPNVAACFERALERHPEYHELWFQAAALHLALGNNEAYRRDCHGMLERFRDTDDPLIAERTAKTCTLVPGAVDDLTPALRLAEIAVDGTEEHWQYPWFTLARSLAAYRDGDLQTARRWLDRAPPTNEEAATIFECIDALLLHELGLDEAAQESLLRARQLLSRHPLPRPRGDVYDWIRAGILFNEADRRLNDANNP